MVTWIVQNTSDIIHDIKTLCECVVFPQKGYIFIHDIAPCNNSKSTRTFKECKEIPILELLEYHSERLEYNEEIGHQMTCKRTRCGITFVMDLYDM